MSGVTQLVASGPVLLAIPVAAAAGAVTFLSPRCLPLVPGYLSYVTGMTGSAVSAATRHSPTFQALDGCGIPRADRSCSLTNLSCTASRVRP